VDPEFELRLPDGRPASHEAAVHLLQHARPVGIQARRFTLAELGAEGSSTGDFCAPIPIPPLVIELG
jgi:hypothetical protein